MGRWENIPASYPMFFLSIQKLADPIRYLSIDNSRSGNYNKIKVSEY